MPTFSLQRVRIWLLSVLCDRPRWAQSAIANHHKPLSKTRLTYVKQFKEPLRVLT
ncbi:MAG: hypothetical protein V7K83_28890 [Nostoc sp.]